MFKNRFGSWKHLHRRVRLVLLMSVGSISVPLIIVFSSVLFPEDLKYYIQPLKFYLDLKMQEGYPLYGLLVCGALFGLGTWIAGWRLPVSLSDDERRRQRRILSVGRLGGVFGIGLTLVTFVLSQFADIDYAMPKDAIINDLANVAAQAYQYRTRPISAGGGGGSYEGFGIPSKMQRNENGSYKVLVTPDTLYFEAVSQQNPEDRIRVKVKPDGRLWDWQYEGTFR